MRDDELKNSKNPEDLLTLALRFQRRQQFAESEHWFKVYLLARPDDEKARKTMVRMNLRQYTKARACKVADFAQECVRRFGLTACSLQCQIEELNQLAQTAKLSKMHHLAQKVENHTLAEMGLFLGVAPGSNPWTAALSFAEKAQQWSLVEWVLDNSPEPLEREDLLRFKLMVPDILEMLAYRRSKQAQKLRSRIEEACRNDDRGALEEAIELALHFSYDEEDEEDEIDDSPGPPTYPGPWPLG